MTYTSSLQTNAQSSSSLRLQSLRITKPNATSSILCLPTSSPSPHSLSVSPHYIQALTLSSHTSLQPISASKTPALRSSRSQGRSTLFLPPLYSHSCKRCMQASQNCYKSSPPNPHSLLRSIYTLSSLQPHRSSRSQSSLPQHHRSPSSPHLSALASPLPLHHPSLLLVVLPSRFPPLSPCHQPNSLAPVWEIISFPLTLLGQPFLP